MWGKIYSNLSPTEGIFHFSERIWDPFFHIQANGRLRGWRPIEISITKIAIDLLAEFPLGPCRNVPINQI